MGTYKLALLGCGRLGSIVAQALDDGLLPDFELVAAMGRDRERTTAFAKRHGCKACFTIQEVMGEKPHFTAEAMSVEGVTSCGQAVLEGGSNLVMLSMGALADDGFYQRLRQAAVDSGRRVYIANGCVGGFDILRTAMLIQPLDLSFGIEKAAVMLKGTPLYSEDLLDLQETKVVFSGTAREAIRLLPTKVNVAISTALAGGAGPDHTSMRILVVPGFQGDEYTIAFRNDMVRSHLHIHTRDGTVAAWSLVAALRNAVAPIVF